jgi:hypothetical protein
MILDFSSIELLGCGCWWFVVLVLSHLGFCLCFCFFFCFYRFSFYFYYFLLFMLEVGLLDFVCVWLRYILYRSEVCKFLIICI